MTIVNGNVTITASSAEKCAFIKSMCENVHNFFLAQEYSYGEYEPKDDEERVYLQSILLEREKASIRKF